MEDRHSIYIFEPNVQRAYRLAINLIILQEQSSKEATAPRAHRIISLDIYCNNLISLNLV